MSHPHRTTLLPLLAAMLLLASCATRRDAYLMDVPRDEEMAITNYRSGSLMPGDHLYIHVDSKTPQSVKTFNQETNQSDLAGKVEIRGYLVSADGDIMFPAIGRIHAEGMSIDQLAAYIEGRLVEGRYVKDPQVTIRLLNFRVTVIGEVKNPSQIHADGNRLTIFEALAQCGDITMDGLHDCITIIRLVDGKETVDTIDLTSREVLNSPYYYLQQNDIVYVEPTRKKKRTAWRNEDWPQYLTTGVSAVRIAYTIYYRYYVQRIQDSLHN